MKSFVYTRKQKVKKLDEKGNPIPVMREVPNVVPITMEPVPGQFETEEKEFKDSFNLDNYLRSISLDDDTVLVVLSDGHEETKRNPELINPAKPASKTNVRYVKEAQWVLSEIELKGDDAKRFFSIIEKS